MKHEGCKCCSECNLTILLWGWKQKTQFYLVMEYNVFAAYFNVVKMCTVYLGV